MWTEPCDVRFLTSLLELFEDITALLDKRNSRDVLYLVSKHTWHQCRSKPNGTGSIPE